MWRKSECRGPWLHRLQLRRSGPGWQEEQCAICKARVVFKERGGRSDNYNYIAWHMRSALQRWHPRYKKEYPSTT